MNELLLRRRVAASKSLPYDAEIEYLESTGTQYIDTGIVANQSTDYEIKLKNNSTSSYREVFGSKTSDSSNNFRLQIAKTSGGTKRIYYNNGAKQLYYNITDDVYLGVITAAKIGNNVYLNGVKKGAFSGVTSYTTPTTITVFALKTPTGMSGLSFIGRIYYLKIGVMDLIPVRVGTTGYLYDKVSGQLFGNDGTGSFILGPDK